MLKYLSLSALNKYLLHLPVQGAYCLPAKFNNVHQKNWQKSIALLVYSIARLECNE